MSVDDKKDMCTDRIACMWHCAVEDEIQHVKSQVSYTEVKICAMGHLHRL